MMNTKSIYHETRSAVYFDNGDGSLLVFHKGNRHRGSKTKCYIKNDDQGQNFLKQYRKIHPNSITHYRSPNNGMTYDKVCNPNSFRKFPFSRRGSIPKKFAMVINVAHR